MKTIIYYIFSCQNKQQKTKKHLADNIYKYFIIIV